jgi:hypothetical protein
LRCLSNVASTSTSWGNSPPFFETNVAVNCRPREFFSAATQKPPFLPIL